jgi:hypothetical protein
VAEIPGLAGDDRLTTAGAVDDSACDHPRHRQGSVSFVIGVVYNDELCTRHLT